MNNIATFNCPSCGAPLHDFNPNAHTITCPFCWSEVIPPTELRSQPAAPSPVVSKEMALLKRLINSAQKAKAIKLYRQIYGGDLEEARKAIEAIATDKTFTPPPVLCDSFIPPDDFLVIESRIKELLKQDRKTDAIKLHRRVYGSTLTEARDAIEIIQLEMAEQGDLFPQISELSGDLSPVKTKILDLLKQARKRDAIDLYQQTTSTNWAEAEAVINLILSALRPKTEDEDSKFLRIAIKIILGGFFLFIICILFSLDIQPADRLMVMGLIIYICIMINYALSTPA